MYLPASSLRRWRPEQSHKTGHLPKDDRAPHETYYSTSIRPGSIIAFGERRAHEVVEISERPLGLWPQHFLNEWKRYTQWWAEQVVAGRDMGTQPERGTWEHRPLVIAIRRADQPTAKVTHYAVRASRTFFVLPEHYSICRLCNEIPPCAHTTTEAAIDREMENAERLMAIPAGCCLGCGEPVTARMKVVGFPGPNLWRPDLGDGSAVFHTRAGCQDYVSMYRKQLQAKGIEDAQLTLPGSNGA